MGATVVLTLDTSAPRVTLLGASLSGAEVQLHYTIDEPGVLAAVDHLGRPFTVEPGLLRLPGGDVGGTVRITTRDDVLNERVETFDYRVTRSVPRAGHAASGGPGRAATDKPGRAERPRRGWTR